MASSGATIYSLAWRDGVRMDESDLQTYLVLNGIAVPKAISLGDGVELLPARLEADSDLVSTLLPNMPDYPIAAIFLGACESQIRVAASGKEMTAIKAWNTIWDGVILGALFDCEVACNFQSSVPLQSLEPRSQLRVTNYHLRAFPSKPNYLLTESDTQFISVHFERCRKLLDQEPFRNAIHALATFRWHTMPRARLAILWAGIEGLFAVDSELVFRVSLYASRFLAPDERESQVTIFEEVKRLYKGRSQAVHGAKLKGAPDELVQRSSELLRKLLFRCIDVNALPNPAWLAP